MKSYYPEDDSELDQQSAGYWVRGIQRSCTECSEPVWVNDREELQAVQVFCWRCLQAQAIRKAEREAASKKGVA